MNHHVGSMPESYPKPTNHLIRFLLVGIFNTLIGLSIMFFLLNVLGWNYWTSTLIGNTIGAAASYILNRNFTFKSHVSVNTGVPRFILIILTCYFISYNGSLMVTRYVLPEELSGLVGSDMLAVIIGTGFYTILNFIGQKYFVFQEKND
ncbi:GtrA family protein [Virgibacillus sp. DJP39]|uniref:GtrA family protein n=1 Tax=Virgibacillus sp. DJP39 TaxID=3409790 RepID=UPI003BB5F1C9